MRGGREGDGAFNHWFHGKRSIMKGIRPFAAFAVFAISLGIGLGASAKTNLGLSCCGFTSAINPTLITKDATNHRFIVTPSIQCQSGGQFCNWETEILVEKKDASGTWHEDFRGSCTEGFPCGNHYDKGCSHTYSSAGDYRVTGTLYDLCPVPKVQKNLDVQTFLGVTFP
jgi:hypothetical protein